MQPSVILLPSTDGSLLCMSKSSGMVAVLRCRTILKSSRTVSCPMQAQTAFRRWPACS